MKKTKEKGITLVALVVTIIVLLILAGVSISTLTGQNGILRRASQAKENSENASEKELISLAILEAINDGNGTLVADNLNEAIKSYLGEETNFTENEIWQYRGKKDAYIITPEGELLTGWITINDENNAPVQVTNGVLTLNIGDYINYKPKEGESYTSKKGINQREKTTKYITYGPGWNGAYNDWSSYRAADFQKVLDAEDNSDQKNSGNGYGEQQFSTSDSETENIKWRVLGTNDKTAELLIVASDVLKTKNSSNEIEEKNFYIEGVSGYSYGADELNNICKIYGTGNGATGGRNLTYEDINKAIGKENQENYTQYEYFWTPQSLEKNAPYYSYSQGNGYMYFSHLIKDSTTGIFNYYDSNTKKWVTNEEELSNINTNKKISTITGDYKGYNIQNLKNSQKYQETNGYKVLFQTNNEESITGTNGYWLSSSFCMNTSSYINWGLYCVGKDSLSFSRVYDSTGYVYSTKKGIRPLVLLKSDIQLEENKNEANTYDIK